MQRRTFIGRGLRNAVNFLRTAYARRVAVALAVATAALLAPQSAQAVTYTQLIPNSTTDVWSSGADWNAVPVSAPTTRLTFDSGYINTTRTVGTTNDITGTGTDGAFVLNAMDLNGTEASWIYPIVNIAGNALEFRSNGATTPVVNLNATVAANSTFSYVVKNNLLLTNNTTFTGASTAALTLSGAITGAGSLTKSGTSTLVFSGSTSYSGGTTVTGGTLRLDFNGTSAPTTNIMDASSSLVLNGGTLNLKGKSATNSQTFTNGVTLNAGASGFSITDANASNYTLLALNAITRNAGSTVNFTQPTGNTTVSATNGYATSNTLDANTGLITSVGAAGTVSGTDWATTNGINIVAYTGYTTLLGASQSIMDGSTTNVRVNNTSTLDVGQTAGTVTVSSLLVNDAATRTITVGAGNIFRLGAIGGILVPTGTGAVTIGASGNAGTLTAGGADNTAGEIVINHAVAVTVNSVIANNGLGAVALTKSGAGTLTLTGANTYTGATYVNAGTLSANAVGAVGGALYVNSGGTFNQSAASLASTTAAVGLVVNGGTATLSQANTYTGTTAVLSGTLNIGAAAPSGSPGALGNATSEVLLGDISGPGNAAIQITVAQTVARNVTVQAGNSGIATLAATGTNVPTYSGTLTLGSSGAGHGITLSSAQYNGFTISGLIQDPSALVGAAGGVSINASGYVHINNTGNNYTGGTTLNSGTLIIGSNNALGSGRFTINGGTLAAYNNAVLAGNTQTWANNFGWTSLSFGTWGTEINLGTGAVLMTGTRTLGGNNKGMTVGGVISDGGSGYGIVYRNNSGTANNYYCGLTLNGASTFSGGVTVDPSNGQVQLSIGNLGTSSTNSAIGTGTLIIASGTKTATINISAASGTLATSNNMIWNNDFTLTGNSVNMGTGTVSLGTAAGTTRTITTGGNTYTIGGVISDGTNGTTPTTILAKAGTGTLALTGANTYSGGTIIAAGTLAGTTTSIQGNVTFSNAVAGTGTLLFDQTLPATPIASGTYAGVISQTGGIVGSVTKNNAGTVILTGASTYTGTTTVNGGTLQVDANQGGSLATTPLTLGGGVFSLLGKASNATIQNLGAVVLNNAGTNSAIAVDGGTSTSTTLNLGGITATTAGTALNINTATSGSTTGIVTTTQANTVGGILGGRITLNGADFAANGATPGTSPIGAPTYWPLATAAGTDINNTLVTDNALAAAGTTTTYSLKILADQAGQSLTVGSNTLTLTSGGVLFKGDYDYTIASAGVIGNLGTGSGDLIFHTYGSGKLTVTSAIVGAISVTKTGPGTLVLAPTDKSTYAGGSTFVDQGILRLGHSGALGAGSGIVVNAGATLDMNGIDATATGLSGAGTIDTTAASGTATLTVNAGTFGGVLQNTQGSLLALVKSSTGTLTLTNANTFSGFTTVNAGAVNLSHSLALQNSTLATAGVVFSSTVASHAFTLGGLSGNSNITLADNATTPNPVALSVGNNGSNTTYSGILSGSGRLIKVGSGTLIVDNPTQTYSGGTTVSNGTLLVNNSFGSGTGTGTVTVAATATLGGGGSISGATTVQSGGIYSPGNNAVGTLTHAANLNFDSGSTFKWEHTAGNAVGTPGTDFDVVSLNSGAQVNIASGAKLALNFAAATDFSTTFWDANQTWNIVADANGITGNFAASDFSILGSVQTSGNNTIAGQGSFATTTVGSNLVLGWTAIVGSLAAGNGTWAGATGNLWTTHSSANNNWADGYPSAAGNVATFSGGGPGNVDIDANITVGKVALTGGSYTLGLTGTANALTMDNGASHAEVKATSGSHTINAKVKTLAGKSLDVIASGSGSGLTLVAGIDNSAGANLALTQELGATLLSAGSVANAGAMTVSGTVGAKAISGIGSTSVLASASLTADSIVQGTLSIAAGGTVTIRETTGGAVNAVPEPGTWVLIATALLGWLAFRRRR